MEKTKDPVLETALAWSEAINAAVRDMVYGIPPFPNVRKSLEKIAQRADVIVCSTTAGEALNREWRENDVKKYTRLICGQEMGTKKEHIKLASDGKYPAEHVLMIGDAIGDLKAARVNNALFFPIIASQEASSWQLFFEEAADRFLNGEYGKDYEQALISKFERTLSDIPPWKR